MNINGVALIPVIRNFRIIFKGFSMLLFLIVFIGTSCSDDDSAPSDGAAQPACQLIKQSTTSTGKYDETITYTLKYTLTYEYDDAGNLKSDNGTYNYAYTDGKSQNSTSAHSYQYDDKGFLIRSLWQYSGTDRDGKSSASTSNEDYTYENGRLVKDATQSNVDGVAKSYVFQYVYDDAGKVIKYSNTYNNSSTTYEYNGNIVQKMTTIDAAGNSTTPFLEYNAKGWLTKYIQTYGGTTDESRYEFNSEGLIISQRRYINSKPSSGSTSEYDTKENPFTFVYGRKKGFPIVPSTQPEYLYKHNVTTTRALTNNAAYTDFEPNGSTIYVYDYNTKNFPTMSSYKNLDKNGMEISSASTIYTYANCQ